MTRILVIDPGMTSGVVYAEAQDDSEIWVLDKWEVPGGMEGLAAWHSPSLQRIDATVCEKFRMTPRVRTAVQVEPLRIEGLVYGWHPGVVWQYPDSMLLAGGHHGSPSRNKTAADKVLRDMGLWTLPSEVDNHTDANDINSAMKHLVAYLRNNNHRPTLEALGVL